MRNYSLSDVSRYAVGGPWEPITKNFGGINHSFLCKEENDAAPILVDSADALRITSATATKVSRVSNRVQLLNDALSPQAINVVSAGAIVQPGTKTFVIVVSGVGANASSGIVIGGTGTPAAGSNSFRFAPHAAAQLPTYGAVALVTASAAFPAADGVTPKTYIMMMTPGGAFRGYHYDGTTYSVVFNDAAAFAAEPTLALTANAMSIAAPWKLSGLFMGTYTTPPITNIESDIRWIHDMAQLGSGPMRLPPWWKGLV